jgi:predicted transcriptional regulator
MLKKLFKKEKKSLRKKAGDDKLVISLVLIAIGVALCFVYKNEISTALDNALKALSDYVDSLLKDVNSGALVLPMGNLFKL